MASRFVLRSDSDTDSERESSTSRSDVSSPVNNNNDDDGPNPYWFEVTEDEDEEENREVLSRETRSSNDIFTTFDKYEYAVSNGNFVEALKHFNDLSSKATAHLKKYGVQKICPLEETDHDAVEGSRSLWEVLQDSAAEGDEQIEKAQNQGNNYLTTLQRERVAFRLYLQEVAQDVRRRAAEVEKEESELDENGVMSQLENAWYGRRSDKRVYGAQSCATAIKVAEQMKWRSVLMTAKAVFALLTLKEESRGASRVPQAVLVKCYDSLSGLVREILSGTATPFSDNFERLHLDATAPAVDSEMSTMHVYKSNVVVIPGGFATVCATLFEEIRRAMQQTDLHQEAYAQLLQKENDLADLAERSHAAIEGQTFKQTQLAKLILSIVGQRTVSAHETLMALLPPRQHALLLPSVLDTVTVLSGKLSPFDFQLGILYRAYQHALAGSYQQGKDIILRSAVQEDRTKSYWNDEFSILYNRVVAQLGLAAFAGGRIQECHESLQRLFFSDDKKEWGLRDTLCLLGQALVEESSMLPGERVACKELLVPKHFHIQYSHLELAGYVSALLVDTVAEARRPYSRLNQAGTTRKLAMFQQRFYLCGAPSTTREALLALMSALKNGDCGKAVESLSNTSAWETFPFFPPQDGNRKAVLDRVKEEALRVFCYTFACSFSNLSLKHLADRFLLSDSAVKSIVNQTLLDKESPLVAFWDEAELNLLIDRGNVTRLQHLVDNASTKVADLWALTNGFQHFRGRGGGRGRGRGMRR